MSLAAGTIDVVYDASAFNTLKAMGTRNLSKDDILFREQFNLPGDPSLWESAPFEWSDSSGTREIRKMDKTMRFQVPYDRSSKDAFVFNFPKGKTAGTEHYSFEATVGAISNAALHSFLELSELERAMQASPRNFHVQISASSELLSTDDVAGELGRSCIRIINEPCDIGIPLYILQAQRDPAPEDDGSCIIF